MQLTNFYIMKRKFLTVLAILTATVLITTSCKKDTTVTEPTPTYIGYWKGKYGPGTNRPTLDYAMLLKTNGSFRIYEGTDTATAVKYEGSYTVTGTNFTGTYNLVGGGIQYTTLAGFNAQFTSMDGTYGSGTNTSNGGSYVLNK